MVLNLSGVLLLVALLFWPVHLPILYNEPFPVFPTEVKRGETISYVMEYDKRQSFPVDIYKNIVCDDGNLVTLAPKITNISIGRGKVTPTIVIPEKTSLGICHVEIEHVYKINPVRTAHQSFSTDNFDVIE